jgi:hypothetical protein
MPMETEMLVLPDADSGPESTSAHVASSEGELLKRAMARLAAVQAWLHPEADGAAALFEMPAEKPAPHPDPMTPKPNEGAAPPPRSEHSPEMKASLVQLLEANSRINRFVRLCNSAIHDIPDAPDARDTSKQRSQSCAS